MKDEEMAEEYIEKNCKIWEEGELSVDEIVRLAYLAGLKAGRQEEKLTKAKEIISAFVEWANWQGGNCPNFKSIQDKAEQFLKEIEK